MAFLVVRARALALAGWGVAQLASFVVALLLLVPVCVGVVFALPPAALLARRNARRARRLARSWSDVDIPEPYAPAPPPPRPEADGLYRHRSGLVKSARVAKFFNQLDWLSRDPATWRDIGFLLAGPLVGVPLAVLGVLVGEPALRLHGRWTWLLLRPRASRRPVIRNWLRPRMTAFVRLLGLLCLTAIGVGVAVLAVGGLALGFGLGLVFLISPTIQACRWLADQRRQLASEWFAVVIPRPYAPEPEPPRLEPDGRYRVDAQLFNSARMARFHQRLNYLLGDTATWRELLWVLVDPVAGGVLLAVPAALVLYGIWVLAVPSIWLALNFSEPKAGTAAWLSDLLAQPGLAVPAGLALAGLGLALLPAALRVHTRWSAVLLRPERSARLARRVDQLTRTRAEASDAQAAELRRIERDLHDGAQARMLAVGLQLGALERLIDTDPAAAKALAAQARETAARALTELRDLVRGIHPPVLAERGLGDAVRALALDAPIPVSARVDLPGRLDDPVESAAYFAVNELLVNVARHAAARTAAIDIAHRDGLLRIQVVDDGHGGADPRRGSGLRGIERRLAAFDGRVGVESPPGGPTAVTLELPCVLSSPRTSTSSATA